MTLSELPTKSRGEVAVLVPLDEKADAVVAWAAEPVVDVVANEHTRKVDSRSSWEDAA